MWWATRRAKRQFRELREAIEQIEAVIADMRSEFGDHPPPVAAQIKAMEARVLQERLSARELKATLCEELPEE